ncbi:MAG: glycerophosphodiester phosphodiesterase [bacterium]
MKTGVIVVTALALAAWSSASRAQAGGRVVNCAHRGASGAAPENTLAAFRAAVDAGADMFELDVRLTGDGQMVVIHDDALDRTTDGAGKVSALTLDEIKKLDAGAWFDEKFRGERVPTLRESLEFARGKIRVNIEIKEEGFEEQVVKLVEELDMVGGVFVSSFHHDVIRKIKDLNREILTGALVKVVDAAALDALVEKYRPDAINPRYIAVTPAVVKECRRRGLMVFVYTVNEPEMMKRLVRFGVDGVITNYPEKLKEIIAPDE